MAAHSEEEFLATCQACNELLTAPDSAVERVAISWLHVIREHPVVLPNYAGLIASRPGIHEWRSRLALRMRNVAATVWQFGLALRKGRRAAAPPIDLPARIDVLFVSYLLNVSQAGQADDFYFSSVPRQLVADGVSTAVALVNATGHPASRLQGKWAGDLVPRIVVPESLPVAGEWSLFRRLRREGRRLAALARTRPAGLRRNVARRAALEARSSTARRTLRMEGQIAELVARLKPRAIVVAHEGHAWERIAFAGARRANPDILCVGYQHSSIFRLQYAIRQQLAPQYMADQIMTSGMVGKSQLEGAPALKDVAIEVMGSSRAPRPRQAGTGSGLRGADGPARESSCLVIPEGIPIECDRLFEFSLACARLCPDVQFVWRLHPAVTFDMLLSRNAKLRSLPANIRRSEARLEDDMAVCQWALYRGTTAIVQAVGAGLRPIYLRLPGEMSIDPLYTLPDWRAYVETAADFRSVVRSGSESPDQADAMRVAREFCEQMFVPFNRRVLIEAMTRHEASRRRELSSRA